MKIFELHRSKFKEHVPDQISKKLKIFEKASPPRFVQKLMLYHVVPSVLASFVSIIGKIEVKFDKNVNLGKIESRRDWCSSDVWTVDVWPFWNKKTFLDKWIFFKYIIYYKVFKSTSDGRCSWKGQLERTWSWKVCRRLFYWSRKVKLNLES